MGILSRLGYSSSGHSSRHSSSRRRYRHRHHQHRRHYRRHHRHYYRSMGYSRAYSRPMMTDDYFAQRLAHKQMAMQHARLHHHQARMRMAHGPMSPVPRFRPIF